jgi:hypothetical protein
MYVRLPKTARTDRLLSAAVNPTVHTKRDQEEQVPRASTPERHASPEEVVQAFNKLRPEEVLRLKKRATLQIGGTEYTNPLELLSEAVQRAMIATDPNKQENERGRPWPMERVELLAFLSRSIDSIADTSRQSLHQKETDRLEALAGDEGDVATVLHDADFSAPDIVDQAIDLEEDRARQAAAKADADLIEQHFAGDQAVLAIIEGEKEEMSPGEVQEMFGLNEKTYDSARRRLRRQVDKLMPGRSQK